MFVMRVVKRAHQLASTGNDGSYIEPHVQYAQHIKCSPVRPHRQMHNQSPGQAIQILKSQPRLPNRHSEGTEESALLSTMCKRWQKRIPRSPRNDDVATIRWIWSQALKALCWIALCFLSSGCGHPPPILRV